MFWELICMLFYLCNILYRIMENFSLIRGRRHGWPNHVKTSCIFMWVIIYLFVFEFILSTSKIPLAQQGSLHQAE